MNEQVVLIKRPEITIQPHKKDANYMNYVNKCWSIFPSTNAQATSSTSCMLYVKKRSRETQTERLVPRVVPVVEARDHYSLRKNGGRWLIDVARILEFEPDTRESPSRSILENSVNGARNNRRSITSGVEGTDRCTKPLSHAPKRIRQTIEIGKPPQTGVG